MTAKHIKLILLTLTGLVFTACTKTVTNNVPGATASTPALSSQNTTSSQTGNGGVINGGGGKGVLCKKNGTQTVELLDLYEARNGQAR